MNSKKALILAGGDLRVTLAVQTLCRRADFIVAADGGLRHAERLDIKPNLVVGDFDSATPETLGAFADVPRETHSADKDLLDLELAIDRVLEQGITHLHLLGVLGSRFDQSLAAVLIAARHVTEGASVSLHSGVQDVFFLAGPERRTFALPPDSVFSVLSLVAKSTLSLEGAKFRLDQPLKFGVGLGVSNRTLKEPLTVTLVDGLIALVVEHGTV